MTGPPDKPVTTPEGVIAATDDVLLLHVPPADRSLNAVDAPTHMPEAPVMPAGNGSMVMILVAEQPAPGE